MNRCWTLLLTASMVLAGCASDAPGSPAPDPTAPVQDLRWSDCDEQLTNGLYDAASVQPLLPDGATARTAVPGVAAIYLYVFFCEAWVIDGTVLGETAAAFLTTQVDVPDAVEDPDRFQDFVLAAWSDRPEAVAVLAEAGLPVRQAELDTAPGAGTRTWIDVDGVRILDLTMGTGAGTSPTAMDVAYRWFHAADPWRWTDVDLHETDSQEVPDPALLAYRGGVLAQVTGRQEGSLPWMRLDQHLDVVEAAFGVADGP